jgi:hypothetical protein
MSRFNVLVVGNDVDWQLAHFDDNRTTAPRREYVGPHVIASMARAYDLDVTDLPALAAKMPQWRACPGGVDARGLYTVTTYNRDAKWDEYEVGGSWAAFFLLKPVALASASEASPIEIRAPLRAAVARKGDIDFDGMRSEAEARGREVWRAYAAAVTGTPETIPAVVFDAKVRNGDMSRAAARRAYRDDSYAVATRGVAAGYEPDTVSGKPPPAKPPQRRNHDQRQHSTVSLSKSRSQRRFLDPSRAWTPKSRSVD